MQETKQSKRIYDDLCKVIPGGVNSPVRSCRDVSENPLIAESGSGDQIYDPDGNGYIDYCMSWGPLIHGHAHPRILEATQKRMAKGTSFGVTTEVEYLLAQKIVEIVSSIEKIRFVSSGTEATMTAARLARGYTGKNLILKFNGNYHGHADFFLVNAGSGVAKLNSSSSAGVPEEMVKHVVSLPYNDIETVRAFLHAPETRSNLAAVILEPIAGNMGVVPGKHSFLRMIREETEQMGALLIFDEVISGFRAGLQGAQGLYGIQPDLTCFGKIIGGGFPAAAFGGRREVMDYLAPEGPVYQAGTLSGNPIAMEAGLQTLLMLEVDGFYEELERKTNLITAPVKQYLLENQVDACIQQAGSLFTLFFGRKKVDCMEEAKQCDLERFGEFYRFMFDHGVYVSPSQFEAWFVSMAHTVEHLKRTRDLILEFFRSR